MNIESIIEDAVKQRITDRIATFLGRSYYNDSEFYGALKKALESTIKEEVAKRQDEIRAAIQKSIDAALPEIETRISLNVSTGRR